MLGPGIFGVSTSNINPLVMVFLIFHLCTADLSEE
jgi:hypothetical protein